MVNPLVLGIDGGGTQTRARVATGDGQTLGEGRGGPCNIAALPTADALASVLDAAGQALGTAGQGTGDVQAVCAGVAGTSYADRRDALQAALEAHFTRARVLVVPDFAIALTGATNGGPGVIVIAGTGSAAYGENAAGQTHRAGGYGYLLDDAGSGYGVGRAALASVLHAADGTGEPTRLAQRVLSTLALRSVTDIVPGVYGGGLDRVAVASLSRVVAAAAQEDNDAVARAILMRAGGALAQTARGVTSALFSDTPNPFPLVTVGGLWSAGAALSDVFTRSVARFAPHAVLREAAHPPVQGAVLRALQMLD